MRRLAVLFMFVAGQACAQVGVEQAWTRATPPGATVAGGYMTLVGTGAADRLIGASSPAAARVEIHVHRHEDGVMRMRQVPGIDVPAGGRAEFRPGGAHLMFVDVKRPFRQGDTVSVNLRFEKAGELTVRFAVQAIGASGPAAGHPMKH